MLFVVEATSSTKSIQFQYLTAAPSAILKHFYSTEAINAFAGKHFYGIEAINAFAEGAAGAGQCKCTENAFGEVYRGYCSFVVV